MTKHNIDGISDGGGVIPGVRVMILLLGKRDVQLWNRFMEVTIRVDIDGVKGDGMVGQRGWDYEGVDRRRHIGTQPGKRWSGGSN